MPPADNSALKRLAGRSNPGSWYTAILEGVQASVTEGRQDPGWFHPSQLSHECDANLAFWFLGAPAVQSITARLQRIFDLGHGRDADLKRDTATAGISLIKKESDRKIEIPLLRIRGELDEWVKNPATETEAIIDFKTMNMVEFTALKEVKRSHKIQMLCYQFGKNVQQGFVLYECKNDQSWKLMPSDFDNKMWQEEVVSRIERILAGLENDLVIRNPVSCSSCPFNSNSVCTSNQIRQLREASGLYV